MPGFAIRQYPLLDAAMLKQWEASCKSSLLLKWKWTRQAVWWNCSPSKRLCGQTVKQRALSLCFRALQAIDCHSNKNHQNIQSIFLMPTLSLNIGASLTWSGSLPCTYCKDACIVLLWNCIKVVVRAAAIYLLIDWLVDWLSCDIICRGCEYRAP